MRNVWQRLRLFALLLGCSPMLQLPAAIARQTSPPLVTPPQQASASSAARAGVPDMCFDGLFQGPLPGKLDYCLGLRDWKHGHFRNGMEFLALAAGWGNKNAQYTLGLIYYGGHHVAADPPLGLAWLKLANERHNDPQIQRVTLAAFKWATPLQRERAALLFGRMQQKYGDKVAAARAWRQLAHWKFDHGPFDDGCAVLYPAQSYVLMRAGLITDRLPMHPAGKPAHSVLIKCVPTPVWRAIVQKTASQYFHGLYGTVTVGPLESLPAPVSSTAH